MADLSHLSDDDLAKIANGQPHVSQMSDADLEKIASSAAAPSTFMDTLKGFGSGVLQNLNPFLGDTGPLQTNENDPQFAQTHLPREEVMASVPGSSYQPQGLPGRIAQSVGQQLPAAVMPGSGLIRALRVAVPGVLAQAGREVTKGTAAEPYAGAAGAVIGGLGTGMAESLTAGLPSKTIASVQKAADDSYQAVNKSGMQIAPDALTKLVTNIKSGLNEIGLNEKTMPVMAKKSATALDYLESASDVPMSLQELEMQRRIAGLGYDPLNKTDTKASYIIKDAIDNFVKKDLADPTNVIGATDQNAISSLSNARDLWAKSAQAQTIQDTINKAAAQSKWGGASVISPTFEQSLRTKFGALAANQRGMAQFPSDVQTAIKQVATGGSPVSAQNLLRYVGSFSPTSVLPGMAEIYGATTHPTYAIPAAAAGFGAKIGATALTKNAANRALATALQGHALPAAAPNANAATLASLLLSQNNQGNQ